MNKLATALLLLCAIARSGAAESSPAWTACSKCVDGTEEECSSIFALSAKTNVACALSDCSAEEAEGSDYATKCSAEVDVDQCFTEATAEDMQFSDTSTMVGVKIEGDTVVTNIVDDKEVAQVLAAVGVSDPKGFTPNTARTCQALLQAVSLAGDKSAVIGTPTKFFFKPGDADVTASCIIAGAEKTEVEGQVDFDATGYKTGGVFCAGGTETPDGNGPHTTVPVVPSPTAFEMCQACAKDPTTDGCSLLFATNKEGGNDNLYCISAAACPDGATDEQKHAYDSTCTLGEHDCSGSVDPAVHLAFKTNVTAVGFKQFDDGAKPEVYSIDGSTIEQVYGALTNAKPDAATDAKYKLLSSGPSSVRDCQALLQMAIAASEDATLKGFLIASTAPALAYYIPLVEGGAPDKNTCVIATLEKNADGNADLMQDYTADGVGVADFCDPEELVTGTTVVPDGDPTTAGTVGSTTSGAAPAAVAAGVACVAAVTSL